MLKLLNCILSSQVITGVIKKQDAKGNEDEGHIYNYLLPLSFDFYNNNYERPVSIERKGQKIN